MIRLKYVMRTLTIDCTKILQVVLLSRERQWAAISLYVWRREPPYLSHTLENLRGLQLVSPLIDAWSIRILQLFKCVMAKIKQVNSWGCKNSLVDVCILFGAYLHTVSLWQATAGPETREESVLQINDCLAHFFIPGQHVIVIHTNL